MQAKEAEKANKRQSCKHPSWEPIEKDTQNCCHYGREVVHTNHLLLPGPSKGVKLRGRDPSSIQVCIFGNSDGEFDYEILRITGRKDEEGHKHPENLRLSQHLVNVGNPLQIIIRYDTSALPPQSCPSGQVDQAVVRKSGSLHALSRRGQSSSKCVSAMGVFVRKVHAMQVIHWKTMKWIKWI